MLTLPEFETIAYLQDGSDIQVRAFNILMHSKILYHLRPFDPVLTGTIPIDLCIEGKSDLDIACCSNNFEKVEQVIAEHYSRFPEFSIKRDRVRNVESLIISFRADEKFVVEVFCQAVPTREQHAYQHLVVEYELLRENDHSFKQEVLDLKRKGYKTEPAFCKVLGLTGDPYEAILIYYEKLKNLE